MSRIRLPARRAGYTFEVRHPGSFTIVYTVKIGFDEEGQPKEIFLSCNKLTTALHIAGIEIATLVSIALQHGASLETLAAAMPREDDNRPQGAAGAVLDAVIEELKLIQPQPNEAA